MGGLRGRAALSWQAGLGSEVGAEQEQTAELELEPSEEEMGGGQTLPHLAQCQARWLAGSGG